MLQLAESLPGEHESLRFWGKITTRGDDYIVVEGKAIDETLGEFDEALQEGKDGGNRYTYWVTRSAGGEWKELPPVNQAQITAARKVQRYRQTGYRHLSLSPIELWCSGMCG